MGVLLLDSIVWVSFDHEEKDFNVRQGPPGRDLTSFVDRDELSSVRTRANETLDADRLKTQINNRCIRAGSRWLWHVTVSRYMTSWHFRVIWPSGGMRLYWLYDLKYSVFYQTTFQVKESLTKTKSSSKWNIFYSDINHTRKITPKTSFVG